MKRYASLVILLMTILSAQSAWAARDCKTGQYCPGLPWPPPPPGGMTPPRTSALVTTETETTSIGITLDTEWKKQIYAFARANVVHPAWGIAHSERDYQVALQLAEQEGFTLDRDALFAAAFLHDLGGIGAFAKPGVDHAVRSVELAEPLLRDWGFPMAKWPQVRDLILGHIYYGPAPANRESQAFRDADILDFLGTIGVARILAITEDPLLSASTLKPSIDLIRRFRSELPGKLSLNASKRSAGSRLMKMDEFLESLSKDTLAEKAL